ncbi:MAG TPA: DUF2339 domain-containing protein [Burkholderiaceae bacterium]|nr:DUF2339 domain-containing protein [Burkholderiaceae bacterium]HQR71815.1 DUF2339 domain-containing protein [Burkholderiaceae bacterium]
MIEVAIASAKAWLLGGNTVARVGLLLLFIGVAFLLRYVAEHTHIPIEWRLTGVALGAIALLIVGWRLRSKRPGYAITLQGGAIGILYLTVFAALRLYNVLPPVPAFALLAALAVLSGVLAVAQNARALAALGATGGFLAPILVSTGAGRIELLLSYYLLLNLGVLGVAWFRAWRELNWIGFAFTFGVFGLWVVQRYVPEQYLLAQGFLAAFWLLFLVVSLLYALRQPEQSRGLFDTTLMFALPLAAFGVQSRLTEGVELALAAVVAAGAYLASSAVLLRRGEKALRLLTEASFGVGVAFLTLAVPLAASAQWTAAAWALEGLAVVWVGTRQKRLLPIAAGLALHLAGAISLFRAIGMDQISLEPELSGFTLNLLVFALTAFASGWLLVREHVQDALAPHAMELMTRAPWILRLVGWAWVAALLWQPLPAPWYVLAWCAASVALVAYRRRSAAEELDADWLAGVALAVLAWLASEKYATGGTETVVAGVRMAVAVAAVAAAWLSLSGSRLQRNVAAGLLTLGVVSWLTALLFETWQRIDDPIAAVQVGLLIVVATAMLLFRLAHRVQWSWPVRLSWVQFVAHVVVAAAVVALALGEARRPSAHYGALAWPLAWALFYLRLHWEERAGLRVPTPSIVHVAGLGLGVAMVTAEVALQLDRFAGDGWYYAAWGALPAAALWLLLQYKLRWPMRAAPFAYATIAAPGLAAYLLGWIAVASVRSAGDAAPLPYLPVLNPLDIATLLALFAVLRWHLEDHRLDWQLPARAALGAGAFVALNAAALRAVHVIAGVPWTLHDLGKSLLVQAVLSLLWTVSAMGLMVFANRRAMRPLWLVGAALLGVVVLKLFLVDLSARGTVERIVSFVGVGALILLIGYLAPVPPTQDRAERETA